MTERRGLLTPIDVGGLLAAQERGLLLDTFLQALIAAGLAVTRPQLDALRARLKDSSRIL
jgi:hypothetical protein